MTVSHQQGHWPEFERVLCGSMNDRERLGLPDFLVENWFARCAPAILQQLRGASVIQLLEILGDAATTLERRLVAGNLLALVGDPRIDTLDPAMVTIEGATVHIGLDIADVEQVLARMDKLGLDASWIAKECPRHAVPLAHYRIGRYPVTNHEYRDFLLATHYPELPSSWSFRRYPLERANHPVYSLSAQACDAYAQWLSRQTGRVFRLPSEAEWEYAAAGPQGREFPWGEQFDMALANTCESGLFDTSPVGAFAGGASVFGVHDLAGNVEEYVADAYRPYPGGTSIDDHLRQIQGNDYRIARGGSFARYRDLARTRRRHGHNPRSATYAMGFRLAETL